MRSEHIRNVAIIAHVDHGKTSLVDTLLREARVFRDNQTVTTCVMDRHDLERERGITIFSKACAVTWRDHRINIIDTPGHADFGGEVERVLRMADAAVLVVCAHDGPMPQTRFVLRKALSHGLRVVILVNKVDRKDSRASEVPDEVFSLLIDLGAPEDLLDAPVIFASARDGRAGRTLEECAAATDMHVVLDTLLECVPAPKVDPEGPVQLAVAQIDWDDYLGRLAVGRVSRGRLVVGQRLTVVKSDSERRPFEVKKLFQYHGLERTEIQEAVAGDIVLMAGVDEVDIGDTICHPEHPEALARVHVDPPTVSMRFVATDSAFRGRDGDKVTSRQLRERLMREARANVALRVEESEHPDQLDVKGRGLLHLGILIEEMRREGYEFSVARPQVIERRGPDGERLEPIEDCVVDVPEAYAGKVIEVLGTRRGEMVAMNARGDHVRLEFVIPSRGLIGIRSTILNVTRGEAQMTHQLREYGPWRGPIPERSAGVQVSMETGRVTAYAIEALEARGQLFVEPGDEAYVGQIVGEHNKGDDIEVNICRTRALTNIRSATAERKVVLQTARKFGVEEALAYIADDELVEMTPNHVRLRKRLLDPVARKRLARALKV
ncbi:MAG: translational GTPase TypA [Planctomycetota bacterium]|nr:translational GTPase TypA [Planctomycetota bacterium]